MGSLLLTGSLLLGSAACGDDSSDDGSKEPKSADAAALVDAARARYEAFAAEPDFGLDVALPRAPEQGIEVAWLEGNAEAIKALTAGVKEATAALGWKLTTIPYTYGDPQSTSSALSQAVARRVSYVITSGGSEAALGQGLEAAKAAGIPVFDIFGGEEPRGEANGIYAAPNNLTTVIDGTTALVDYAIAESEASAKILYVNYPDSPTLAAAAAGVDEHVRTACPDCEITKLNLTGADLGSGAAPGQVVSALQRDRGIAFVLFGFSGVFTGVPEALSAAGLQDRVDLLVFQPGADALDHLKKGSVAVGLPFPQGASAWAAVDAAARLSLGVALDDASYQHLQVPLWTPDSVPQDIAGEYQGVQGYQDGYKELWKVG